MHTTPFAIDGVAPFVNVSSHGAVQSGWHTFGVPLQPVTPAASNVYSRSPPTYTTPSATAGDPTPAEPEPIDAVHRGVQTFGVPLQPVTPPTSMLK